MTEHDLNSEPLPTPAGTQAEQPAGARVRKLAVICLGLVVLVVWVFLPSLRNGFVNYDDNLYVTDNLQVQAGLSWQGLVWAFARIHGAGTYWHPLTWVSHMLDCQLYGLQPWGHHLTNLLLHAVNTLLVFFVFWRMTGAVWRCAFLAALFALHPLQVDTVAWIAERKNLLSTLFWLLTTWAYVRYGERPGWGRYALILLFFASGLLCKPALVTLPFVLLLLDYWPLRRFRLSTLNPEPSTTQQPATVGRLVLEKTPLLLLATASSLITLLAHQGLGMLDPASGFPMGLRIENAIVSYVRYLGKTVWPFNLAVFYPYPDAWPMSEVVLCSLLLVVVSGMAIRAARSRPYLFVGWFWFLGVLVPFIGLVQVGAQAMADRFMYVPVLGLLMPCLWGAAELTARWRHRRTVLAIVGTAAVAACGFATHFQVEHWRNGVTLFSHTIAATGNNALAECNLGNALGAQGHAQEAIPHLEEALRISPAYAEAHLNLGVALVTEGKIDEAIVHFETALEIRPAFADAHNDLGGAFLQRGQLDEAAAQFRKALELNPGDALVLYNLGSALLKSGRVDQALAPFQQALDIRPDFAEAHSKLGIVLLQTGQVDEAIMHFQRALAIRPGLAEAHYNLGKALFKKGREDEAMVHFQRAVQLNPNLANVHSDLGSLLLQKGRVNEALTHYEAALELQPGNAYFLNNLAWVLATCPNPEVRNGARAVELAQKAERLSGGNSSAIVGTLAAAYAEAGRFGEAVKAAQRALDLATAQTNTAQADMIRANIALYAAGLPLRDTSQATTPSNPTRP